MSLVCFRNGSLAREWVRIGARPRLGPRLRRSRDTRATAAPHAAVARARDHAARRARRPPPLRIRRADAALNVRALVEGQMMAMANHAAAVSAGSIASSPPAAPRSTAPMLQVMANVFGVDVDRLDVGNSRRLGAALRAYHADRLAADDPISWTRSSAASPSRTGHRISPNPEHVAIYADLRSDYADAGGTPQGPRAYLLSGPASDRVARRT